MLADHGVRPICKGFDRCGEAERICHDVRMANTPNCLRTMDVRVTKMTNFGEIRYGGRMLCTNGRSHVIIGAWSEVVIAGVTSLVSVGAKA